MKFKSVPLLLLCSHLMCSVFAQSEDMTNAAYLWRHAVGGAVQGRPVAQAQSVVAVLDGGTVTAYSAAGRLLWNYHSMGRLGPHVSRSREGSSYICRTNGVFIAINRAGRELWRVNIGGALAAPAVCGWDGRVFIPTARKILCYTASGNPLWARELESDIAAGPWLDKGGGIMLSLENGDVMRLSQYGSAVTRRLTAPARLLLSIDSSILALHRNGAMQLVDLSQPKKEPVNLPRLPAVPLAAACIGENVAAVLSNGQLLLLSGKTGVVSWIAETNVRSASETDTAVLYDERGIFVLSISGAAGFTPEGKRVWYSRIQNASGVPAFDDSGVLYSGGKDWILYAWKLEDNVLPQARSLYGPAPEGSYSAGISASPDYHEEEIAARALDLMRREIRLGKVGGNEPEWLEILMGIAGGVVQQRNHVMRPPPRAPMNRRVEALELLSIIGSSETIPYLARLFRQEDDPLLKAAAARAIGGIGVDPGGLALNEFALAVSAAHPITDESMLLAIAEATGALCRFSGPPLAGAGVRLLLTLGDAQQRSIVQQQAFAEIRDLGQQ